MSSTVDDIFVSRETFYTILDETETKAITSGIVIGLLFGIALTFTTISLFAKKSCRGQIQQTIKAQEEALLQTEYAKKLQTKYAKKLLALKKLH